MDKLDLDNDKYIRILELISKKTVSGEFIAQNLNISRVAVWKKIKKLEDLGYKIDKSKSGYRLISRPSKLLPFEILPFLKTSKLGKNYIYFEKINSTNIFLKERKDLDDGTVVLAEYQEGGKGRKGRKWISPAYKGLYFSILLKKNFNVINLLKLSLFFGYIVRNVIQNYVSDKVYIKWPNDIYLNEKKLGGILIETELEGNEVNRVIVGIGININSDMEDLKSVLDIATSLKMEEGKDFDRREIFINILENIENRLEELDNFNPSEEINQFLLWKGEKIIILDEDLEGILEGVDSNGGLIIRTDEGRKILFSGDISVRKQN